MIYLKKFETDEERTHYASEDKLMSYTEETDTVHILKKSGGDYLTFVAVSDGTFEFSGTTGGSQVNMIAYSLDDGDTWSEYQNQVSLNVQAGDVVKWKGNMVPYPKIGSYEIADRASGIGVFSASTAMFNLQGNIMSLLYDDDFKDKTDLIDSCTFNLMFYTTNIVNANTLVMPSHDLTINCYCRMFYECAKMYTAPLLVAENINNFCYFEMFMGCERLINAPSLIATELKKSCYHRMFGYCESIVVAPVLHGEIMKESCYESMFKGCTSLLIAPQLSSTTLARCCYNAMFEGCSSLKSAPNLPSLDVPTSGYCEMFKGCTNLVSAPKISATGLTSSNSEKHLYSMFEDCKSLEVAPTLLIKSIASVGCCSYMFRGCTKLRYIKAMFTTTPSTTYTYSWVDGVAENGTFVKNSAATWNVRGVNGIPTGWTVETESE